MSTTSAYSADGGTFSSSAGVATASITTSSSTNSVLFSLASATATGTAIATLWTAPSSAGTYTVILSASNTTQSEVSLTSPTLGGYDASIVVTVTNAIHGTNVKHQAIHTGKPVQAGKFTFELSKHHAGALKEDAPFDPVAHKKELDKLMGKHMAAHSETTKLINAKAPQETINKAQERNNAVKAEIRAHKDKVPKGPAPKPGSAADYYASKKPGEYTGD